MRARAGNTFRFAMSMAAALLLLLAFLMTLHAGL